MNSTFRNPPVVAVLCLVGGACGVALAPTCYAWFADAGWAARDGRDGLAAFLKVVRRGLMAGVLIPLALCLRPWQEVPPRALGLIGTRAAPRRAWAPLAVTLVAGVCLLLVHAWTGAITWHVDRPWGETLRRAARIVLVPALGVALAEELFFRGWLEARWRRRLSPLRAALAVSAVYAGAHAFRLGRALPAVDRDVPGAFEAVSVWLGRAVDPVSFGPSFVGLFLFGLVLSALMRRTRTVWAPVGAHMAAIWFLQNYGRVTARHEVSGMWGSKLLYDGLPAWILLAGAWLLLERASRSAQPKSRSR